MVNCGDPVEQLDFLYPLGLGPMEKRFHNLHIYRELSGYH